MMRRDVIAPLPARPDVAQGCDRAVAGAPTDGVDAARFV